LSTFSILKNASLDIFPEKTLDIAVQTVRIEHKLAETQTIEIEEFDYPCFYCEEEIKTKSELENHSQVCCEKYLDATYGSEYKCDNFHTRVGEPRDLKRHVENHHIWDFPPLLMPPPSFSLPFSFPALNVSCFTCGEKMNFKSELKSHYSESHPEILLFWCDTCFTNFGSERGLKSHMRNNHNDFS
jgi:hypothetical protein